MGGVYAEFEEAEGEPDPEVRTLQGAFGVSGLTGAGEVAHVGGIVRLHWVIAPSEKAEAVTGQSMIGSVWHEGRQAAIEDFATQADLDWCREKFNELRDLLRKVKP